MDAGTKDTDTRAGARWLATTGPADRLQLLAALLSRFNHDFRTPLNTIVGWGHLLQQNLLEPERIRHGAEVIGRNAHEQALKLDEFIEDCRVVLGGPRSAPVAVRLGDALAQALTEGEVAELTRGRLRIRTEADDAAVDGDLRLLQRCIGRLVAVVARRAPQGAAIGLDVSRADRSICLSVAAPARDADWSDSDLLDLRIATIVADALRGSLELGTTQDTASVVLLRLPEESQKT